MKYFYYWAYILLFFICLASCTGPRKIQTEIYIAPVIELPKQIQQILLLDRSTAKASNLPSRIQTDEETKFNRLSSDCIYAFQQYTDQKEGPFQTVSVSLILDRNRQQATYLEPRSVQFLCMQYGAEALMVLEKCELVLDTLLNIEEQSFVSGGGSYFDYVYHFELIGELNLLWRLYDQNGKNILDEFNYQDQFRFYNNDRDSLKAVYDLPPIFQIREDYLKKAGSEYAQSLLPNWIRVERKYFPKAGGPDKEAAEKMLQAHLAVKANQWELATKIWNELANQKQLKHTAGKAAYNLALSCERAGELELAWHWIQIAIHDYQVRQAKEYASLILDRRAAQP